jgi:hypothetical protein
MAIPWLTVLKLVPWNDVIRNAPQLAETARKLWDASKSGNTGQTPPARSPSATDPPATAGEPGTLAAQNAALRARLETSEFELQELQQRVLASSALLNQLAEQNTSLIARVESNRRRTVWLSIATAVSLLIALSALAVVLLAELAQSPAI